MINERYCMHLVFAHYWNKLTDFWGGKWKLVILAFVSLNRLYFEVRICGQKVVLQESMERGFSWFFLFCLFCFQFLPLPTVNMLFAKEVNEKELWNCSTLCICSPKIVSLYHLISLPSMKWRVYLNVFVLDQVQFMSFKILFLFICL